mgnify:CR=1 FL=1
MTTPYVVIMEVNSWREAYYVNDADDWSDGWDKACWMAGTPRADTQLVMSKPFYKVAEGGACD